ncbi:hypothetical protein QR680_010714 [Steinernema hermaphroditum]|uniref:Exosome complex component 10 homolog n=1 Tax=Steinernema hermaphroditum TaxID=289476 RepID=A0AA39IPW6_9BILA|nr:hypothetical protein QR680_010714 [Steinernema hermaphroditum]
MTEPAGASNVTQKDNDQESEVVQRQQKTKECAEKLFAQMKDLYKSVEGIPKCGGAYELYNSYPEFSTLMDHTRDRLAQISGKLLKGVGIKPPKSGGLHSNQAMVDLADNLCEKVSIGLDNLTRRNKKTEAKLIIPQIEMTAEQVPGGYRDDWSKYSALAAKVNPNAPKHNVIKISANALLKADGKPQSKFYDVQKVNADVPFVPILREKHHALKRPQRMTIHDGDEQGTSTKWQQDVDMDAAHPYEYEINMWSPPECQMKPIELGDLKPLTKETLKFVKTKEDLEELRDVLNSVAEFAVDIEHHHLRTFRGIVCLIQISTRTMDYIVDPFPLWKELHILNEPFTDPKILKVFHGGESDIKWLQRDFGIYVVNMFDTGRAMRILEYPKFGLAFLVKHFCDVDLDKQFQKSDWRIRPLSDEHINYARCDTHYLLYCYDRLRNELISKGNEVNNYLTAVYNGSKDICLEIFHNPRFEARGYEKLLSGRRKMNRRQLNALSELWQWRDETARRTDESLDYVLPDHMLLSIAEVLPREMQGIIACCSPVPPPVRNDLLVLHKIIFKSRELAVDENELNEVAFDLGFGDLTAALKNYERMLADTNRITKLKAILHTRLDVTNHPVDEELREMPAQTDFKIVVEKDFAKVFGDISSDRCYEYSPKLDLEKVARVVEKQNEWATPFEHYEVALAEAQREAERKRKIEEEEAKKRPKTTYTHLDPAAVRQPFQDTEETLATEVIPLQGEEMDDAEAGSSKASVPLMHYDDSQILTKKALKKKRKLIEKSADMIVGAGGDDEPKPREPKQARTGWTTATETAETVDYDQFDARMFSQKPKRGGYNPVAQMFRGKRGGAKRGRRGGGFTKPVARSMSYGGGGRGGRAHLVKTGRSQMSSNPSSSRSSEASSNKDSSATTSQASVKRMELTREEKYKTELCLNRDGTCRYGKDCWFAHSDQELRVRPDGRPPRKNQHLKVATPISVAVSEVALGSPEAALSTATDSPAPLSPSPFPPSLMQLFRMPPPHKNNFVPLIHCSLPGFPDPDEYRNILPMLTQVNSTIVAEKERRGSIEGGL